MDLKPGSRWRSDVCGVEIVIVRSPKGAVELACGGHPMKPIGEPRGAKLSMAGPPSVASKLGKRYLDDASGLEVLCTKGGEGAVTANGVLLALKEAKPLPSSD